MRRSVAKVAVSVVLGTALLVPTSAQAAEPLHLEFPFTFETAFTDCADPVVGSFDVVEAVTVTLDEDGNALAEMRHVSGEVVYRNDRTGQLLDGRLVRNHRRAFGSATPLPGGLTEITLLSSGLLSMVVVPSVGISHLIAGRGETVFTLDEAGEQVGKARGAWLAGHDDDGFALPDKICDALTT
jgi:hypothetical protein